MSLSGILKSTIKKPLEFTAARFGAHRRKGENRLWILMYHRILPKTDSRYTTEEPGMIVEPDTFRQHLQQLKALFTVVSLSDWVDRQQAGKSLPSHACAITFDDGWADNYQYAYPIIQQEQVPATLFAVSDMIGTNLSFWPNRLARLLNNATFNQLEQLPWLSSTIGKSGAMKGNSNLPVKTQLEPALLASIVNSFKTFPDSQLIQWLTEAEHMLSIAAKDSPDLVSWQQLQAMSDSGLVEIGSHTSNHFRLQQSLVANAMESEIIDSKQRLQDRLNKQVNLFCYPNGDTCSAALKTVAQHYKAAVTTQRGINSSTNFRANQLMRIGMHQDVSGTNTQFQARLANWY